MNLNIQKKIEDNKFLSKAKVSVKRKSFSSDNFTSLMSQVNLEKTQQQIENTQETPQVQNSLLAVPDRD